MVTITLPDVATAATSNEEMVYCVAAGRVLVLDAAGSVVSEYAAPAELTSLAAAGDSLVAAVDPGVVVWLDPHSGEIRARLPVGGEAAVVSGNGGLWVHATVVGRAWQLVAEGTLGPPVLAGTADRVSADGALLWWTAPGGALHSSTGNVVDLDGTAGQTGAISACSGSIWLSVSGGLQMINAWSGAPGPLLVAPEGPVDHLTCSAGVLVGGSGHRGLFVLDPSVDADIQHLDVDLGGDLQHLVATRTAAVAFPADRAEARVVALRRT